MFNMFLGGEELSTPNYIEYIDEYASQVVFALSGNGADKANNFRDFYGNNIISTGLSYSSLQSKWKDSSIFFNGNNYLYSPLTEALTFTGELTWEAWICPTDFAGLGTISVLGNARSNNGGNFGLFLAIQAIGNERRFVFRHWINGNTSAIGSQPVELNTWYHVAGTKDINNNLEIYVNGVKGTPGVTFSHTNWEFHIGHTYNNGNFASIFRGYIDDIRLTKALKYTSNFNIPVSESTVPIDPYQNNNILLLDFDGENNSTVFYDYCGNSIINHGSPIISTAQFKYGKSSCNFNGINASLRIPRSSINLSSTVNNTWTIECWIYSLSPSVSEKVIFTNYSLPFGQQAGTLILSNNRIGSDNPGQLFNYSLPTNTWVHWAVTRENNVISLYLNGVFINSISILNLNSSAANFIGGSPGDNNLGNAFINAHIDSFRITLNQVRYTTNFTPTSYPFILDRDSNIGKVVSLLHMNGANNSTSILDLTNKVIVVNGNSTISTAQSRFNESSLFLNTGTIRIPSATNEFAFTGDFTCEGWFYLLETSSSVGSIFFYLATNEGVNRVQCGLNNAGRLWVELLGHGVVLNDSNNYPLNSWNHVAFTRENNIVRIFLNGLKVAEAVRSGTFGQPGHITLGGLGATNRYNGYMDEVRITKGLARYTTNFTPTNKPFPDID